MIKKSFLVFLILGLPGLLKSQTLSGMTGLLNIPSADVHPVGTFMVGGNYLPALNQPLWGYGTGNYYLNLTFLPFFEVGYKMTLRKGINGHLNNQDRSASFHLRLGKEKKYLPAMTLGAHDFLTTDTIIENQYFSATYIVFTKHFNLRNSIIGITSGYGINLLHNSNFVGLFGGVSVTPGFFKPLQLMAEYDGKGINLGGNILLYNHFYIFCMAQDRKYFAGGIAYCIYL
ncbi:MAG: YjbH domain-containing protein [Mariniphaga sp.]